MHAVQNTGQPVIDHAHKRIDQRSHHGADQDTKHRINDHRTHTVQGLREPGGQLLQPDHHISRCKSGKQRSQESCVHLAARRVKEGASRFCHKPCHESDRQSRTVCDAHGDVS